MPSPTSDSPGKRTATALIQGPPWLFKLLTPLFARHIADQLRKKHPALGRDEIGAMMRADLGPGASEDHLRLVDAVVARLPDEKPALPAEKPVSAWVLVAANIVPLLGVLFWGWDAFPLLLLFWMENVVIGVLNVLKMLFADPADAALWAGKLFIVPFFCVHYGIFTSVHGVFVLSFFGGKKYAGGLDVIENALAAARGYELWPPIAVLAGSHLFSFVWNYFYRGEFRRARLAELMMKPYGRVIVLHVTILLGGLGAMALGSPVWALVLLIALKIGLDLRAHVKEHSTA